MLIIFCHNFLVFSNLGVCKMLAYMLVFFEWVEGDWGKGGGHGMDDIVLIIWFGYKGVILSLVFKDITF